MQRIYVPFQGKNTTISVDETLLGLLHAKLLLLDPKSRAEEQARFARQAIRSIGAVATTASANGLSQHVQRGIILAVADPALASLLPAQDAADHQLFSAAIRGALTAFIDSRSKRLVNIVKNLEKPTQRKRRTPVSARLVRS